MSIEVPQAGTHFQHYKGGKYRFLGIVRHSETLEELVLYETLYENELGKLWVRPKKMFFEKLEDGRDRFAQMASQTDPESV